jgi:hypothetical protein
LALTLAHSRANTGPIQSKNSRTCIFVPTLSLKKVLLLYATGRALFFRTDKFGQFIYSHLDGKIQLN